jgi:HAMP domain-containing protein
MTRLSIRVKIIALIVCVGVTLGLLLAFFSPYQAKELGREILQKDAEFIANLLAENLALGMQTMTLDDGAALEQTLNLLKTGGEERGSAITTISRVRVFDENKEFVKGLNADSSDTKLDKAIEKVVLDDHDETLTVWSPMRDSQKNILGYVEIDFSKHFLLQRTARNSGFAWIVSLLAIFASVTAALFLARTISKPLLKVVEVAKAIAVGDLNQDLGIRQSGDEIGVLANSFRELIDYIQGDVKGIEHDRPERRHAGRLFGGIENRQPADERQRRGDLGANRRGFSVSRAGEQKRADGGHRRGGDGREHS